MDQSDLDELMSHSFFAATPHPPLDSGSLFSLIQEMGLTAFEARSHAENMVKFVAKPGNDCVEQKCHESIKILVSILAFIEQFIDYQQRRLGIVINSRIVDVVYTCVCYLNNFPVEITIESVISSPIDENPLFGWYDATTSFPDFSHAIDRCTSPN
uniref:Uncharacterized protein n=1 Tax=Spongospora subterranea TaxID=70186 RepID=A0A0H5RAK7_9EUKA|eukprot:CRZ05494.1 hypothetical protein [Spongospora subterranea]